MAVSNTILNQTTTADTFSGWLSDTNKAADALTSVVLTSNSGAYAGANTVPTTGTVVHNGNMTLYGLTANTIQTGTTSLTFVGSNVVFDAASSVVVKGPFTSNGVVVVSNTLSVVSTLTVAGNANVAGDSYFGGTMSVSSNASSRVVTVGNTTVEANVFVYGNISATGNVLGFQTSDKRMKDRFTPLSVDFLTRFLENVPAGDFTWNVLSDREGESDLGVLAQDVASVYPKMTRCNKEGYLSVDYVKMIPILLGAIQMQQRKIDDLERKLDSLDEFK